MYKIAQNAAASWRTTLFGIISGLTIVMQEISNLIDSNPETVMTWEGLSVGLALLGIGVVARDGNISSEQAGAR